MDVHWLARIVRILALIDWVSKPSSPVSDLLGC